MVFTPHFFAIEIDVMCIAFQQISKIHCLVQGVGEYILCILLREPVLGFCTVFN